MTVVMTPKSPASLYPARTMAPFTSDSPGEELGDGYQIQHFLLIDPVILIHKFLFHESDNDVPSPEGKTG